MSRMESVALKLAAGALFAGILIFSGSLFTLIATGYRWLGAITPIGGTLMIAGWILAAYACAKANIQ